MWAALDRDGDPGLRQPAVELRPQLRDVERALADVGRHTHDDGVAAHRRTMYDYMRLPALASQEPVHVLGRPPMRGVDA